MSEHRKKQIAENEAAAQKLQKNQDKNDAARLNQEQKDAALAAALAKE